MEKSIQQKANEWWKDLSFAKIYILTGKLTGKYIKTTKESKEEYIFRIYLAEHPDEQRHEEAAHREVWPKQAIETISELSEILEHIAQSKELFSKEFVYDMENMIEEAKFLIRTHQQ